MKATAANEGYDRTITKAMNRTKANLNANYGDTHQSSGKQELEGNPYSAIPDTE